MPRSGHPLSSRLGWLLSRAAEASALGAIPLAVLATVPLPAWDLRGAWVLISAMAAAVAAFLLNDMADWRTDSRSPGRRLRASQVGIGTSALLTGACAMTIVAVWSAAILGWPALQAVGVALSAGAAYAIWGKKSLWVGFVAHAAGVAALVFLASRALTASLPVAAISGLVVWAWLGWLGRAHDDSEADAAAGLRTPATAWPPVRFLRIHRKLTWLGIGLFSAAALRHPEWWPWAAAAAVRVAPLGARGAWRARALAVAALAGEAAVATLAA